MLTEEHLAEVKAVLAASVKHLELLTPWEADFATDVLERLEEVGEGLRLSSKQQWSLDNIKEKLERAKVL